MKLRRSSAMRRMAVLGVGLSLTFLSVVPTATKAGGIVPTTTVLSNPHNSSEPSEAVTFTAFVEATIGGNVLDGTVTYDFGDGTAPAAFVCEVPPLASFCTGHGTHAFATPGTYLVTAHYDGSANGAPSTSNTLSQEVVVCTVSPIVTTNADSGAGSLRQAMLDGCGVAGTNTITFDMGSVVSPITLTSGELTATRSGALVSGPGARALTINRDTSGSEFRIFHALPKRDLGIQGVTISDGVASGSGYASWGGGVFAESANLTLTGVAVKNNTAETGGGIGLAATTPGPTAWTVFTHDSTISGNTATGSGGGIAAMGFAFPGGTAGLELLNTTISGNEAASTGGGVVVNDRAPGVRMTNVTITNNRADAAAPSGGGLDSGSATAPFLPWLRNVILAGNFNGASPSTTADEVSGSLNSANVNNVIGGDPKIGPLADNGGQTDTHALLTGSPAIEAGNNQYANTLTNDQRGTGFGRLKDGPDADTFGTSDIGAYEADPTIEDISDKATNEDTPLTFTFRIGDASTPTFVDLFATSNNTTLVPNDSGHIAIIGSGQTRTLQITPVASLAGATTITVTYRKSVGGVTFDATDTFELTVNSANDAPTLDAIAPLTISEDPGPQTVGFSGISSGAANESQGFTVTATSNNLALIPDPAVSYTSPDATGSLTFTPAANAFGTATITVRVQDNGGTAFGGVDTTTRTFIVTVNPLADTPQAIGATTPEDTQTSSGLVITRNAADGNEVPYLKVTDITNGRLFYNDGVSEIHNGDFIFFVNTASGLRFTTTPDFFGTASFNVQASTVDQDGGLGGAVVTVPIVVTPVADVPTVPPVTTTTQVMTAAVVTRNAVDGIEVTHFRISGITNGRAFLPNGITEIHDGDFVTAAQGGAGLRFTPAIGFVGAAGFAVQGATDAFGNGLGAAATAAITVVKQLSVTKVTSANPNPSDQTLPITVVYTVTGFAGLPAPTGDVTVSISGGDETCTGTVAQGQCTLIPAVAGIDRQIQAVYGGDTQTVGSTSAGFAHTVRACNLTPTVTSALDDGGPDTLRQTVANACIGTTVTFAIPGPAPHTIVLGSPIQLVRDITIVGSPDGIVISGADLRSLFNVSATAVLDSLTLTHGRASVNGGAIANQGILTIRNSTLSHNFAVTNGGAIYGPPGTTTTIVNSTISGNSAGASSCCGGNGGGIYTTAATLNLTGVTITGNVGLGAGGGVFHSGFTKIANSIIAGNDASIQPNLTGAYTETGPNLLSGNPMLGPLQNNGGPTFTHMPLAGSPALDAGDNAKAAATGLTTDQRGVARVLDSADPGSDQTVDIGAVEADPIVEVLPNVTTDEDVPAVIIFNVSDTTTAFDSIVATSDNPALLPSIAGHIDIADGGATQTLTLTPLANLSGSATVTVTATKTVGGVALTSTTSFTLTVNPVDDPPTLAVASPPAIPEDSPQQTVNLTGITAGGIGEIQPLSITAASNNTALIPNPTVNYVSPGATGSLTYTPVANKSGTATITVAVSDGVLTTVQTFVVTVNAAADTPVVTPNLRAEEDGGSQLIRITRNAADGSEVTHFKITNITGGTLVRNASGLPQVNDGDFLTVSQGSSGLIFVPSPNSIATGHFTVQASLGATDAGLGPAVTADVVVDPVPDTPAVTPATTPEDTQTTSGLVITRNAVDGPEVSHFQILDIFNGTLFQHDGVTPILANDVITAAQAGAGLRFTPSPNYFGSATFLVIGVLDAAGHYNGSPGLAGGVITVSAVADTPSITNATTTVNAQTTSGLVVTRNPADGAEIGFVKITGITGGSLYQNDGATPIGNGQFVLFSQAQTGLRFTPLTNSVVTGHVTIQASRLGTDATLGGAPVTADIIVNRLASTTTVTTSGSPTTPGQTVTFTATVGGLCGSTGGTVQFKDGASALGSPVTLSGGVAAFTTASLAAGAHAIGADFAGNALCFGSSGAVNQIVGGDRTLLTGTGAGGGPDVRRFNAIDGSTPSNGALTSFTAFAPSFTGGVRVAEGDVNGDGEPDYIAAAGPGTGPEISVFDGATGALLTSFFAFEPTFTGGVFVAAGDVNGDGYADVIAGSGVGRPGEVKVFSGHDGSLLRDASVFSPSFTGGVRVAAGDVSGDGLADVIAGTAAGVASTVTILSGADLSILRTFSPYGGFGGGVFVAAGDVTGDGFADVITGAGPGGGPHVQVFDGVSGALTHSFFAFEPAFTGGVRVAAGDVTGDGKADLIVGAGAGRAPEVRVFDAVTGAQVSSMLAYPGGFTGGVFVATVAPQHRMSIDTAGRTGGGGGAGPGGADRRPDMIAGWAYIENHHDTGISSIQVWALPVGGGAPVFLGVATLGDARPDVAERFGSQYAGAGFHLMIPSGTLPLGTYDIAVFAQSAQTGTFEIVRVVRVTRIP